jgi:hypothetical protein
VRVNIYDSLPASLVSIPKNDPALLAMGMGIRK